MKLSTFIAFSLIVLSPIVADGVEFRLRYQSKKIKNVYSWGDSLLTWVDDGKLLTSPTESSIACIDVATDATLWSRGFDGKMGGTAYSRGAKRVARLSMFHGVAVLDARDGKIVWEADEDQAAKLLGRDFVALSRVALHPVDGRLLVADYAPSYGQNAFLLDADFARVEKTVSIDASPRSVAFSPEGARLVVNADEDVQCVTDLTSFRDVFFRGTRIREEPENLVGSIDAPFCSALLHDGDDQVIYVIDNSWATGTTFVHTISTGTTIRFDSRNGHVVLDVDWKAKRIILGGTSEDLTLLDFDGTQIAELKNAVGARIMAVEFSPSRREVLVTDRDGVASIFEIAE